MSRKDKKLARNIGGALPSAATLSSERDSVLMVERLIGGVLKSTIERLSDSTDTTAEEDLTRFFSHFYDPTLSGTERDDLISNFQAEPPRVVLGYPRSTAQFPCYSIILESETESQNFLADHVSEMMRDDDADNFEEYVGAFYDSTYGIYIYAEHPDVCAYLYQFAKSVVHASKAYLISSGIHSLHLSGGDLAPDETFIPENMFLRVLRVEVSAPMSVPVFISPDPRKVRITGIWRPDVVVDGMPSGVTEVMPEEIEDGTTIEE